MDAEVATPLPDKDNVMPETSGSGPDAIKKNKGKAPKRVHKSEREKLKREHLNDLFLDLANALEVTNQNNGKASILIEAARLLKDMLVQVECLKKENVTLLSESQYVTMEKKELEDENWALETQIAKLQKDIEDRMAQSKPDLNENPELQAPEIPSHFVDDPLRIPALESPFRQQSPVVGPVYVIPFPPAYGDIDAASNPASNVSKPHARYPTPADSWPSQLLGQQPKTKV